MRCLQVHISSDIQHCKMRLMCLCLYTCSCAQRAQLDWAGYLIRNGTNSAIKVVQCKWTAKTKMANIMEQIEYVFVVVFVRVSCHFCVLRVMLIKIEASEPSFISFSGVMFTMQLFRKKNIMIFFCQYASPHWYTSTVYANKMFFFRCFWCFILILEQFINKHFWWNAQILR